MSHELAPRHELPRRLKPLQKRAVRLEWLTIAFLSAAIVVLYFVLGSSQAMRTAWIEDILSLVPPIVFLLSDRYRRKAPSRLWPYGFHRFPTLAYLAAALALVAMGGFLVFEAVMTLVRAEHPSIGTMVVLEQQVWLGWLMMAALAATIVPSVLLGRAKLRLARELRNKVLHADADMNRADWTTAAAGIVGVMGIGLGLWWLDSVAALFIAGGILRDGVTNSQAAVAALADKLPMSVDGGVDEVVARVEAELSANPAVEHARVRLRESGQVMFGEAFVTPADPDVKASQITEIIDGVTELDWPIQQMTFTIVDSPETTESGD